jgi:2-hydroxychromene-2-carboxylate isomerase
MRQTPARLADLAAALHAGRAPYLEPQAAKDRLTQHTQDAIAAGVFGVPSYAVDDRVFWGLDALPMLRAYLDQDPALDDGRWQSVVDVAYGIPRRKTV